MSDSVKVFCMIEVVNTFSIDQAVEEVEEALDGDNVTVLHASIGRENVGRIAMKLLEGLAERLGRTFVIRCDEGFNPFIEDYPESDSRPPVSLRVSEIVGIYNERTGK
jgi:hypothetical protein